MRAKYCEFCGRTFYNSPTQWRRFPRLITFNCVLIGIALLPVTGISYWVATGLLWKGCYCGKQCCRADAEQKGYDDEKIRERTLGMLSYPPTVVIIILVVSIICYGLSLQAEKRGKTNTTSRVNSQQNYPAVLPTPNSSPIFSSQQITPGNVLPVDADMSPILYSVTGVAKGDTLNVRSGPGANYPVVQQLPNGYRNIQSIGDSVINDTTEWVHISFGSQTGWVSKIFLKRQ